MRTEPLPACLTSFFSARQLLKVIVSHTSEGLGRFVDQVSRPGAVDELKTESVRLKINDANRCVMTNCSWPG